MSNTVATIESEAAPSPRRQAFAKAKRWSGILAKFVSVQIIVQAIGLVSGLLLIRTLSQREYAYFTLANTMQATLLLLADVGVGSALSATGGKVWQDKQRFSELIATGLHVRKSLAWIGGGIALPVLCWMLITNGTGITYAIILTIAVLLGASYRLTTDVLTMVPRLHGRIDQLQKQDLISSVFRMVLIGAACLTFVNAAVAVFVASLSFGVQYLLLKRWTREAIDTEAPTNAKDKQTILHVVKQQAPIAVYYCVQSQLTIFLLSIFGSTKSIAQIGALGRLAVFFSIVGSIMGSIVLPRFARCQGTTELRMMYWQIVAGIVILSGSVIVIAAIIPGPLLWILGKQYAHLEKELVTVVFSTAVSTLLGTVYALNATRAWTNYAWLSIPITIAVQIVSIPFLNLGTIAGVVIFTTVPNIFGSIPYLCIAYQQLRKVSVGN